MLLKIKFIQRKQTFLNMNDSDEGVKTTYRTNNSAKILADGFVRLLQHFLEQA